MEVTPFYSGFMSQWFACEFEIDGVQYNCTEQWMMAEKARLFKDEIYEKLIMDADHPRQQKAYGRKIRGFDKEKWDEVARDVVYRGNYAKFTQNPGLECELCVTKGCLVEASPVDKIWGVGMSQFEEGILDPNKWKGTNWLGEVLVKVRDDILAGVETQPGKFDWS